MPGSNVGEIEKMLPDQYAVSVIMERRHSSSRWADEAWESVGITVGGPAEANSRPGKIRDDGDVTHFLHAGFSLRLHVDECESYYHNLMTPHPRCYVVARLDEEDVPIPFLVSLSFDEAHAYLEAGDAVYAVDIPPAIYRWCEAYVLAHYVPQRKYKRKLTQWAKQEPHKG